MSVKTSPRRLTTRRRACIVADLRTQRFMTANGMGSGDFAEVYARTVALFETMGDPITSAESHLIGV